MKSSPNTPEKPNGPAAAKPTLSPTVRAALIVFVVLFAGFYIQRATRPPEPETDLQPPFDAAAIAKFAKKPKPSGDAVIFLPNSEGQLRRVTVKQPTLHASTSDPDWEFKGNASFLLRQLIAKAPADFPKGTRVLSVKVDESKSTASVDLSPEFSDPGFWQGSTRTKATVYAIVNTLTAVNPKLVSKVQILVNGKPVDLLGELDAAEPFEPDSKLVATS